MNNKQMTTQKQHVQMAAKLYECQESAKKLFREEYQDKISFYVTALRGVMATEKLDELNAVLFVSKLDSVKDNGMAIMLFMAAAVEIIEPSTETEYLNQQT